MHQLLIKQTHSDLWFAPSSQTPADSRQLRSLTENSSLLQMLTPTLTAARRSFQ